jgi:uncharacterized protein DUF4304
MSEIARIIDAVLTESLVPALKAARYRRSARTWRRVDPASTRVVNAQGSSWNTADMGQFTINLGLYFPELAPLVAWGRTSERPTEPACQVRMRIGHLMPGGLDRWWKLGPTSDVAALAAEVREAWDRYAVPWLEAHDDLEAARPLVAAQYAYGDAALSLALGERADAERLIRAALAGSTQRGRTDVILAWAQQHGFDLAAA